VVRVRSSVRSIARRLGYDIVRFSPHDSADRRRQLLMRKHSITTVVDVGANTGQYGQAVRSTGYAGRILSFEPIPDSYNQLRIRAHSDKAWECQQIAIGDTDGVTSINVSANSVSSSILPTLNDLVDVEPAAAFIRSLEVPLRRLDSVLDGLITSDDNLLIKMDVQGYEHRVIDGALATLRRTRLIESELSLVSLYDGQHLYRDTIERLEALGFALISLERGFSERETGRLLQMDGIFEQVQ
jgi:FkbM family methyltransferase